MAFIATASSAERSANALIRWDSSRTNAFPAAPDGTEKMFLRQCTVSA